MRTRGIELRLALTALALTACGDDAAGPAGEGSSAAPTSIDGSAAASGADTLPWLHLTRGARAESPRRTASVREVEGRGDLVLVRTAESARLELRVEREAWSGPEPGGRGGEASAVVWSTPQPALEVGRPAPGRDPYELSIDRAAGDDAPAPRFDADVEHFGGEPGTFTVEGGKLRLCLAPDEEPPASARLSIVAAHQAVGDDGRWLLSGRRVGGEGLAVWPGERVVVRRRLPPGGVLRFATVLEPALLRAGMHRDTHRFRVLVDGEPQLDFEQRGAHEAVQRHALTLPPEGGEHEIAFEVEGPFAYTAFLEPVVGPATVGSYGARPADLARDRRPDVVVFLADTLRADRLQCYGSEVPLSPNLDRFAREARWFPTAWSVSTHTLPTHSSLFSGLYPRQNGQVDFFHPLPRAVDTLAERLAALGYRTAAVTDGIMVSQTHGMAQGFGTFDERARDLDATLERVEAVLEADDGRPLFLFVQTYATHAPYTIRARTRAKLGEYLDAGATLEALLAGLEPDPEDPQRLDPRAEGTAEVLAGVRTLYDASVVDLDAAFGTFLERLAAHGLAERGYLIVTSDHGESLGEHDRLFHAGVAYETELRVPLLLRGPGIEPGPVKGPASLIDFAPTVADIVGLEAPASWPGRSLLHEPVPRAVFAFQCRGERSSLAVVDDGRKLIGFEDVERRRVRSWLAAYDVERDPEEVSDLFQTMTPWPHRLKEEYEPRFVPLLTPIVEPEEGSFTGAQLEALRAMGYVGDDAPGDE